MVMRVAKRVCIFCLGWLLIAAGIVLSLPFVPGPGFLVILLGLLVLASEYHWAHNLLERVRRKVPRLAEYEELHERVHQQAPPAMVATLQVGLANERMAVDFWHGIAANPPGSPVG